MERKAVREGGETIRQAKEPNVRRLPISAFTMVWRARMVGEPPNKNGAEMMPDPM